MRNFATMMTVDALVAHEHSRTANETWRACTSIRAERSQGDRRQAALREAKRKELEEVAAGKKPYFLKGSDKKKLSLEQRYTRVQSNGVQ